MKRILFLSLLLLLLPPVAARATFDDIDEADTHVAKAEGHLRGTTFEADAVMTVQHGGSERELKYHVWTEAPDKAVIKVSKPAKDRDFASLRNGTQRWSYFPSTGQLLKVTPGSMLKGWMGSDFSFDDLLGSGSLGRDYTHKIADKIRTGGYDSIKIVCTPKQGVPVPWSKVILWVRGADSVPIRQEFYGESGELEKMLDGKNFKTFGKHTIPTTLVMKSLAAKDDVTTIQFANVVFDAPIDPGKFTQEFLRKPF